MSVVAKVLGKVLIRRISHGVDEKLQKEQAGLRQGRSTIVRADLRPQEHFGADN